MSLKVYTGIKFKSKNLNEILGQLNSIKEQAVKNVIDYYINNTVGRRCIVFGLIRCYIF